MRHPDGLPAWAPPSLQGVGYLGTCTDAEALAGEAWLAEQGCTSVRGPVEGATWYAYRVNQGPHRRPAFYGEPVLTEDPWPARGYAPCARYSSTLVPHAVSSAKARAVATRREPEGWSMVDLEELGATESTLRLLHRLSHDAFAEAFSFTPLPWVEFEALYRPLLSMVDPRLVVFARDPEGRVAGFGLSYPDPLAPALRQLVVKTIAVHPRARGLGLGTWLTGETQARGAALGLDGGGVHALMWLGSHSQRFGGDQGELLRRYLLYEKVLSTGARGEEASP